MGRPFKGLAHAEGPDPAYDVVVIGAGIAGLVCANLLAKKGIKTLLVESHYQVGGYCSTFMRKRFIFDAASHFYPLLGNEDSITGKIIREIGIDKPWIKMDPVDTFHFPDGSRFEVPADLDPYLARLHALFPHESAAIDAFFGEVKRAYAFGLLRYFREVPGKRFADLEKQTLREVLDRHFSDPKLKLLLCADCPHWGSPPNDTSFMFDSMLRLSYFLGNYYPVGGSQVFANDLAACFEQAGGHILMKTAAVNINSPNGKVESITLELGPQHNRRRQQVKTPIIISNADMLFTLKQLCDPSHFPDDYLTHVESLKPSFPCYLLHMGVDGVDSQTLEQAQGYYWDGWDADLVGKGSLRFKIFVPTLYEPEMAPPGKHIIVVQKVFDMNYEAVTDWAAHKSEVNDFLRGELRKVIPGIDEKIEVANLATAKTSYRFTNNHHGAMLGWTMSPDQLGERRPGIQSPLPGLFFTGHWTRPGGGITPVIVSAQRAADLAASALNKA